MTAGQTCTREVVVAAPGESLRVAAQLMLDANVGSLVVCEDRAGKRLPLGILTDRDIVRALLQPNADLDALSIGQVMSRKPLCIDESEGLSDAIREMRRRAVRRAPVVDASGALIGILVVDDLLDLLVEELSDIARLIQRQITPAQASAASRQ